MTVSPLAGYLERFQLRVATWERVPALIKVYLVAAAEILFIILWQLLRTVDVKFEVDSMIESRNRGRGSNKTKRVAIVTGGDTGVGFHVCKGLLKAGYRVCIASFHENHGRKAVEALVAEGLATYNQVYTLPLDLSDSRSIVDFVEHFVKSEPAGMLNLLVNNAGQMDLPFTTDPQGIEMQVSVNFLGHARLTKLLIPLLKKTPKAMVVNVGSSAHYGAAELDFDSFTSRRTYSRLGNYAQSKACVAMHSIHTLAPQLRKLGIGVVVVHPGLIPTGLYSHNPLGIGKTFACLGATPILRTILHFVMLTEEQGAWAVLVACLQEHPTGSYLAYGHSWKPSALVRRTDTAAKLVNWTKERLDMT